MKLLILAAALAATPTIEQDQRELAFWKSCFTLYQNPPRPLYDHDHRSLEAAAGRRIAEIQRRYSARDFEAMYKNAGPFYNWTHRKVEVVPFGISECRAAAEQVLAR